MPAHTLLSTLISKLLLTITENTFLGCSTVKACKIMFWYIYIYVYIYIIYIYNIYIYIKEYRTKQKPVINLKRKCLMQIISYEPLWINYRALHICRRKIYTLVDKEKRFQIKNLVLHNCELELFFFWLQMLINIGWWGAVCFNCPLKHQKAIRHIQKVICYKI